MRELFLRCKTAYVANARNRARGVQDRLPMHKHRKPLRLRKETLRQLTPADLAAAAGGRAYQPRTYYCTKVGTVIIPDEPDDPSGDGEGKGGGG